MARFPGDVAVWLKALLIAALAIQTARLLWALATGVGPVGDWRPASPAFLPAAAQSAIIAAVNPFDRQAQAQAAPQLPNDLKLFGVRDDVGSTAGGAIVGTPDGQQVSVSIGETIMPGVVLVGVGFDYADVERQGARQRLFLDPDKAPETLPSAGAAATIAPASPSAAAGGPLTPEAFRESVIFAPRMSAGKVTGISVAAGNDAGVFASAGFQRGDVIISVNGARISSATDLAQLQQSLVSGANLSLTIQRGGQAVPLTLKLAGSQ